MPTDSPDRTAAWSTHDRAVTGPAAEVLAAGMLPWRQGADGLQVMVIHRPRYDDWSWPKGKLDPGETLPECAVRELAEEVRLDLRPGVPLAVTAYTLPTRKGRGEQSKEVWYWAAEVVGQRAVPDGDEVDEARWVSPDAARRMLTNESDAEPLARRGAA